jgi:Holliday junction resolvase RusA-like endonuclease
MIKIEIPTLPIPWAAPKMTRSGFVYDIRSKEKKWLRWNVKQLYTDQAIQGYVVIDFTFYFPVPSYVSKKKKALMLAGEIIPTSSDCTNLQKLSEDCVKNIIITDDRNVAQITSRKLYGEKENIIIKIWTLRDFRNETGYR